MYTASTKDWCWWQANSVLIGKYTYNTTQHNTTQYNAALMLDHWSLTRPTHCSIFTEYYSVRFENIRPTIILNFGCELWTLMWWWFLGILQNYTSVIMYHTDNWQTRHVCVEFRDRLSFVTVKTELCHRVVLAVTWGIFWTRIWLWSRK